MCNFLGLSDTQTCICLIIFFRVKKEIKKNLSCQKEISIFDQSKSMNWKKSKWSQKCMNYVEANLDLRNHNFSGVNQEWFDLRNTYELWKPVGRVNLQVEIFLKLRFHCTKIWILNHQFQISFVMIYYW